MKSPSTIPALMPRFVTRRALCIATLWLLLSALSSQLSTLFAQDTDFTYQGHLADSGQPASGIYDLQFTIFDLANGGSGVAGPQTNSVVAVSNGLFTVTLDFGASVFTGADRWLEIAARTNGSGDFTTLTPRQKLTAAPYAVTARNITGVVPSASLSGTYSSAVTFNNAGNSFSGSGAGLTGVNAATLGGLNSSSFWRTTGNSGTTPAANFLGTTDNQPLELRANGQRGLLLIPGITGFGVSVVAGSNTIEAILPSVAPAATISGGQGNLIRSGGFYSTISGGLSNMLDFSAQQAVIAGGIENRMGISANGSVISGGQENLILSNTVLSVIAGGYTNTLGPFVSGSSIGGGSLNSIQARVDYSVIGGGRFNRIQPTNESATIAGGVFNEIQTGALESTISGGSSHTIASNTQRAFIGGGNDHSIASHLGVIVGGGSHVIETNSLSSFIGGGSGNRIGAGADYATIPGGRENVASGLASFAAGNRAQALHGGSFVWADSSSSTPFPSTTNNQFLIRAQGGVGIGINNPSAALQVVGTAMATSFQGSGSGLTGLNAANISSGTLADARLSGNVALLNSSPTFAGDITMAGGATYHHLALSGGNALGYLYGSFPRFGDGIHLGYNYYADANGVNRVFNAGGATSRLMLGYGFVQLSIGSVGDSAPTLQRLLANSTGVTVNGTFNNSSDRNAKQDFAPVSPAEILEKVTTLPLSEWSYKEDAATRHIGPMAQDFYSTFNIGTDDKHIAPMDEGGVALAAIQGLNQKLTEELERRDAENAELKRDLGALKQVVGLLADKLNGGTK